MIVKASMSDQIRSLLLGRIVSGSYKPGDKLCEVPLSEEFGTSVAPVREALRSLESLRVVESMPFKGTRVKDFSSKDIRDAYQIRAILEQFAIASMQTSPIDELRKIQAQIARAIEDESYEKYIGLNFAFHRAVVASADSQLLMELWNVSMVWSSIRLELLTREPESLNQVVDEVKRGYKDHEEILALLEKGDNAAAGNLLKQHAELFSPRL